MHGQQIIETPYPSLYQAPNTRTSTTLIIHDEISNIQMTRDLSNCEGL